MRPASDTARRDVSPLLGEAEGGGKTEGVVEQSTATRRCGILPRRHGGAGSSTSLGPCGRRLTKPFSAHERRIL